jgi:D-sedoheptulose 7-phosphate isomerase
MDVVEKIITLFHRSIAARAEQGEILAPPLADAAALLASTFIHEKRLLLCGFGNSAINAQHFATVLLNQHERERPGLPAQLLDSGSTMAAIGHSYGPSEVFSRQIRAQGQAGDLLMIYTTSGNPQSLINAVQAAHERGMRVIYLGGNDGGHIAQLLGSDDLEILVPIESEFAIHEMHLLITYILCDLIDDQLFGGNE